MTDRKRTKEVWRDIPGYEGYYQASNLGRIRSLDRSVTYENGYERFYKGMIIKGSVDDSGYRQTALSMGGIRAAYRFSQLVAMAFLRHKPNGHTLVVDHVDGDKSNDRVENLRIVPKRDNTSTCFRSDRDSLSSKYVGVHWSKGSSKWCAQIAFNGEGVRLGCFADETEASITYQSALSKIEDHTFNPSDYEPKWTSKYKGVCFHKTTGKWQANIRINGNQTYLGLFPTEIEAYQAYQDKLKELDNNTNNK